MNNTMLKVYHIAAQHNSSFLLSLSRQWSSSNLIANIAPFDRRSPTLELEEYDAYAVR
jgi:hypothetical protein